MRVLLGLVSVVGLLVLLLATTAISVLSHLDDADIAIQSLLRGDVQAVFASGTFWRAFPSLPHPSYLVTFGPAALMATIAAFLAAAGRRWPRVPLAVFALFALLAGVVPYAVGAVALADNVDPAAAGPWLLWMLVGPALGSLLALALVLRSVCSSWRRLRVDGRGANAATA